MKNTLLNIKCFSWRVLDYRWNQIHDSLMLMYEKLARFGIVDIDDRLVLDSGQERDNEL